MKILFISFFLLFVSLSSVSASNSYNFFCIETTFSNSDKQMKVSAKLKVGINDDSKIKGFRVWRESYPSLLSSGVGNVQYFPETDAVIITSKSDGGWFAGLYISLREKSAFYQDYSREEYFEKNFMNDYNTQDGKIFICNITKIVDLEHIK